MFLLDIRNAVEVGEERIIGQTTKFEFLVPSFRFRIGMVIGFAICNLDYLPEIEPKSSSYSLSGGAFARRYFAISDNFFFALEGALIFARSNNTFHYVPFNPINNSTSNSPTYDVIASLRPLFIFFPSPKLGIEAGLGALNFDRQQGLSDHHYVNTFNLSVFGFSLGLAYYFKRN